MPGTRDAIPVGLIWAQARGADGRAVIGADGGMPWHVPEDLARFKRTTLGRVVVVGRRTWESFPPRVRPLPGRTTVVVTRTPGFEATGDGDGRAVVAPSADAAIAEARRLTEPGDDAVVWVAGGAQLYAATLRAATVASVTELDVEVVGDTFAPVLDEAWERVAESPWTTSRSGVPYRFVELRRTA